MRIKDLMDFLSLPIIINKIMPTIPPSISFNCRIIE